MKKTLITVTFVLFASSCLAQESNVLLNLFGVTHTIPAECELFAERSIYDNHITYYCESTPYRSFATISIFKPGSCSNDKLQALNISVVTNKTVSNIVYMEYLTTNNAKSMYHRLLKNERACLIVSTSSESYLKNVTTSLWK